MKHLPLLGIITYYLSFIFGAGVFAYCEPHMLTAEALLTGAKVMGSMMLAGVVLVVAGLDWSNDDKDQ